MNNKMITENPAVLTRAPTARETALYTRDMLLSLRKLALGQRQKKLASLIEAAATEASLLADTPVKRR